MDFMTVTVNAAASTGEGPLSYAWEFGDGATATGVTATHTYLVAGPYTITLTVTDVNMATATATRQVTAIEPPPELPPVAVISADIVYLDVSVDGSGSYDPDGGTIVSWAWNFGDGSTASGPTATHSYLTAGVKTITLTVTDSDQGLTGTATTQVTAVEPPKPPVASFDFTTHYLSASFTSTSTDPDSVIVTWAWDFGDGGTATGETATHAYAAGGTYPVTLTVTDSQTLSDSVTQSVTVAPNPPPVASFTWSVSGTTVSVDASGSTDDMPIASYAWDFGDGGTATGVTASHTYVKPVLSAHVILITPAGVILQEPPPYTCVGYTYGPDGVTAMPNSAVTVTNGRTGATLTTTSDPDFGIYQVNMNKFVGGVLAGDPISVTATNGALSGTNTGVADPSQGYLMIDVVMMGSGPVIVDYTITLTVTDSEGLTDSMSAIVTITFPA
jgi:PKD repeat protein